MRTKSEPLNYPDFWLRIIAIPSIAMFSQHIGLNWEEIADYVKHDSYSQNTVYNISVTFLLWQLCRHLIIYLDQRLPYETGFAKRLAIQLGLSLLITVVLGEILDFLYIKVLFQADYGATHWHTDLPVKMLFTVLVNLIYVGFYLTRKQPEVSVLVPAKNAHLASPEEKPISMISRNKTVLIQQSEIVLFASQERLTFAFLKDGRKLLVEKTIKQLREELIESIFFQANRGQIIQRQYIAGYQKSPTRKLLISLHYLEDFREEISVSKAGSPAFLAWLSA
ncbi:MAG: LytTR family transcriptional regulator DNA-binding domain-containing protein [Bacteroidia bacterium]